MKDRTCPPDLGSTTLALRLHLTEHRSSLGNTQIASAVTPERPAITQSEQLCNMVRSSLHNLSPSGTIVLFTPVITPAGSGKAANKPSSSGIDPFETLGRALSRHHRRIRHVPYVPSVGFTETHDAFLTQTDIVIVLICEPSTSKHQGLGNQVDFADAALEGMESNQIGRTAEDAFILIQCGDPGGSFWPELSQHENCLKCHKYDADVAQQIARTLFEPRD